MPLSCWILSVPQPIPINEVVSVQLLRNAKILKLWAQQKRSPLKKKSKMDFYHFLQKYDRLKFYSTHTRCHSQRTIKLGPWILYACFWVWVQKLCFAVGHRRSLFRQWPYEETVRLYKWWEPIIEQHSVCKNALNLFQFQYLFSYFLGYGRSSITIFHVNVNITHSIYSQESSGSLWEAHFSKNSVSLEWIEIFQFCLKIWHLLRLPHPWVGVWIVWWVGGVMSRVR